MCNKDVRLYQLAVYHQLLYRTMIVEEDMDNIALTEAVFYILISLYKPLHGYGIMQNVFDLSRGRVDLAAGTLYGAISSLLEKGWIQALPFEEGSRKKEYKITGSGDNAVKAELNRLQELLNNGQSVIKGGAL